MSPSDALVSLARACERALERSGCHALIERQARMDADIAELEAALRDARDASATLDRRATFTQLSSRHTRAELEARLASERRMREEAGRALRAARRGIAEELPAFGILLRLDEVIEGLASQGLWSARGIRSLNGRGRWQSLLDELAADISAKAVEGYEPGALDALHDRAQCEALAARPVVALEAHERLGFAPMPLEDALAHCARSLLAGPFFPLRDELLAFEAEDQRLLEELREARAAVSVWDVINIFSTSPEELRSAEAARALKGRRERRRDLRERGLAALHEALRAFPPFELVSRLVELRGVLGAVMLKRERRLTARGAVSHEQVISPGALISAAVLRALEAVGEVLPGLPYPWLERHDAARALGAPARPVAVEQVVAGLRGPELEALRDESLELCAAIGELDPELERTRARISTFDRLVFWHDTEDERAEDELETRRAWLVGQMRGAWREANELAEAACAEVPAFALRDLALAAFSTFQALSTRSDSSSMSMSCPVRGREDCEDALAALAESLRRESGVRGSAAQLRAALAKAIPSAGPPEPGDEEQQGRLDPDELVSLLARRLHGTDYVEVYEASTRLMGELRELHEDEREVQGRISLFDRINIFSRTPDEQLASELGASLRRLSEEQRREAVRVEALLGEAMAVTPAAALLFGLEEVHFALSQVTARCERYEETSGFGEDQTRETRYRCVLSGKTEALAALRRWARELQAYVGELPGTETLLLLSERARLEARLDEVSHGRR